MSIGMYSLVGMLVGLVGMLVGLVDIRVGVACVFWAKRESKDYSGGRSNDATHDDTIDIEMRGVSLYIS